MPIYAPGLRDRHNRPANKKSRNIIAMLSLTAMVDMFTVLVVFLLQNYQVTGEVLDLDDTVELPKATETKELKPAHVVVVSKQHIMLDKEIVASFNNVREQEDWMINSLHNRLVEAYRQASERQRLMGLDSVKQAVDQAKMGEAAETRPEDDRRVTVQADKSIDFLTIKKVMYTLKEAGAGEVNFAVLKREKEASN